MKGINLPASVMGLAFVAVLLAWCWGPVEPVTPPDDGRAVLLAESLATARAEGRQEVQRVRDSAKALPPSVVVRWAIKRIQVRDTAWRMWSPDSIPPDTSELAQCREVVRKCETDLAVEGFVADSAKGELVQCRYDAQVTADALAAKSSGYWRGFGHGAMVGGSAALAVCGLVD